MAPWLSVADATQAVDYNKVTFGTVKVERLEEQPGSVVIAHLSICEATFWVQQDADASP